MLVGYQCYPPKTSPFHAVNSPKETFVILILYLLILMTCFCPCNLEITLTWCILKKLQFLTLRTFPPWEKCFDFISQLLFLFVTELVYYRFFSGSDLMARPWVKSLQGNGKVSLTIYFPNITITFMWAIISLIFLKPILWHLFQDF